ncbi:MAG: hypothetical protein AB1606_02475 [Nitrospirota bacterium]
MSLYGFPFFLSPYFYYNKDKTEEQLELDRRVLQAALSVDEAVQVRLAGFLSGHEERYSLEFTKLIEKLKRR